MKKSSFCKFVTSLVCLVLFLTSAFTISVFAEDCTTTATTTVTETTDGFLFETRTRIPQTSTMSLSSEISYLEDVETVLVIPLTEEYRQELSDLLSSNSSGSIEISPNDVVDPSLSMSIHITATFEYQDKGVMKYVRLHKAVGGFTGASGATGDYVGSGVYVTGQELYAGIGGKGLNGSPVSERDTASLRTTLRNWTYYAPSEWDYVFIDGIGFAGITYTVTLARGTSGAPWEVSIQANYS